MRILGIDPGYGIVGYGILENKVIDSTMLHMVQLLPVSKNNLKIAWI